MAITRLQNPSAATYSGASVTCSFGSAPTAGNLLIAYGSAVGALIAGASISGWTLAVSATKTATSSLAIWYKISDGSETNVTLNWTGATTLYLTIEEWSGITTPTLDKTAYTNDTGSGVTSRSSGTTSETSAAEELACAFVAQGDAVSSLSWTNSFVTGASNTGHYPASKVLSSTGAQETTASWTTSRRAGGCIATFMAGSSPSGQPMQQRGSLIPGMRSWQPSRIGG